MSVLLACARSQTSYSRLPLARRRKQASSGIRAYNLLVVAPFRRDFLLTVPPPLLFSAVCCLPSRVSAEAAASSILLCPSAASSTARRARHQPLALHLRQQWDYAANAHLGDVVIKPQSNRKVWWMCDQCPDGHPHT